MLVYLAATAALFFSACEGANLTSDIGISSPLMKNGLVSEARALSKSSRE